MREQINLVVGVGKYGEIASSAYGGRSNDMISGVMIR
jgi:hypothetical protein